MRTENSKTRPGPCHRQTFLQRLASSALCLLALAAPTAAQEPPKDVTFDFSPDPAAVVLMVTYDGGTLGIYPVYTLYGDGRLEYRYESRHGNVLERWDFTLDYATAKALLKTVVDHGLAESSTEDIVAKVKSRREDGKFPSAVDSGSMILEINLTSYVRDGEELGPLATSVVIHDAVYLGLRVYPDIPELAGLADMAMILKDYRKLAQKKLAEQAPEPEGEEREP